MAPSRRSHHAGPRGRIPAQGGGTRRQPGLPPAPSVAARAEAELRRLAYHDHLTGLPNRVAISERIEVAIERCGRSGGCAAVLLLDIDDFKRVNERVGHAGGDELLVHASERLTTLASEGVTAGRDGANEFLLLVENLPGDAAGARASARAVCDRVAALLSAPFTIGGTTVAVTASIGASLFPGDATDAGALVQHATQAMYEAKRHGRAQAVLYEGTYQRSHVEVETSLRVRGALARGEFELYYQPVIEIADGGGLGGLEALLRWNDPERGVLSPGAFLPHLEESHLLLEEITEWVFAELCWQLADWRARGFSPRVSFNIPARQLRRADFARFITETAALHGADLTRVAAEVIESDSVDLDTIVPVLSMLGDAGLVLSLDDFGIGYSSLRRLRKMPFSLLKTDLSLMQGVPDDPDAVEVMKAVIALGQALGMVLIVEGVETDEQLEALLEIGCRVAQGYHLGRPVPAAEIEARYGPGAPAGAGAGGSASAG